MKFLYAVKIVFASTRGTLFSFIIKVALLNKIFVAKKKDQNTATLFLCWYCVHIYYSYICGLLYIGYL